MIIDYAALADLAEAMGLPNAGHLRESAEREEADRSDDGYDAQSELDDLRYLLNSVPEPTTLAKHDDDCWQRHARYLADRILDREYDA